jgi:hypothetical protein
MRDTSFNISLTNGLAFFDQNESLCGIRNFFSKIVTLDFNAIVNRHSSFMESGGSKSDIYFCRFLLKQLGVIDDPFNAIVKNQKYQPGY